MKKIALTLFLLGLMAVNATAAVTSTFNQVDPGSALAGYVSNTWDVTTGSDKWLSAELLVDLSIGSIYQDPLGTNAPPNPALFGTNPALAFDSYMTGGTDSQSPSTIGPSPTVIGGAIDIGGATPATFSTTKIDATWVSSLPTKPSGDLMLGRITLSDDAQGFYSYRLGVNRNEPSTFAGGYIVNGAMTDTILTSTFSHDDPGSTLSGYISNIWNVNTFGEKWLSAELLVDLTSGSIYQDPLGNNAPPNPGQFSTNPTLEYDSYMTGGTDSQSPSTSGTLPTVIGGAIDVGGGSSLTFDTSKIDATWVSSLDEKPSGELILGRVTLSDDAQGTFKFRIGLDDSGASFFLGGQIVDGEMLLVGMGPHTPIPGDTNDDGKVDGDDAATLASHWLTGPDATWAMGDFNGDGYVNDIDATIMATNWQPSATQAAVPEPGVLAILLAGLLCVLARRR